MKTRMERYFNSQDEVARTKKNQDLYEDIYTDLPSSSSRVPLNESEIDLSKIKELMANREGYKRVKEYEAIMNTKTIEDDDEEYDIYEDIDNKIYDINMILEEAKSKRVFSEREKYRSLRNTQYDILSKLNLNEELDNNDEMVKDFFTKDTEIKKLLTDITKEIPEDNKEDNSQLSQTKSSIDLFADLKGNENTILTKPVTEEESDQQSTVSDKTETSFYTNHLQFTKEDFEGFQNLQSTVKKNNILIKILISILTVVLIAIVAFIVFTL